MSKQLHIGVDGNEANVEEKVGVSVYSHHLLSYFQKKADEHSKVTVFLRGQPRRDMPEETGFYRYRVVPGAVLWSQIFLPLALWRLTLAGQGPDVFFSPAHYAPRFTFCPTVVTIHDLSYLYYPGEFLKRDLYQLRNWTSYSLKKARHIIAVSKTTKKDLMREYAIADNRISVVYNGYEKENAVLPPDENTATEMGLTKKKYILYVGTIQPRKNITCLIRAFRKFHAANPDMKLVIAGRKGWLFDDIFAEAKDLYLKHIILFPGYVPDSDLPILYREAFCFVLPSLYEGFGIPVLEAMGYGCPVIASFTSSLPEIGGEACLYIDPKNPDDLTDKLNILNGNAGLRAELAKKGRERVAAFSWNACGQKTWEILTHTI